MSGRARAAATIGRRALADLGSGGARGKQLRRSNVAPAVRANAAIDWLCRAQDVGPDRGFSYGYTIRGGWQPSYVETTGYIIGTLIRAATALDRPELGRRADEAGDWLSEVQLGDGSFSNPELDPDMGVVFDTGQDLHGLLTLAELKGGSRFDEPAKQAAEWLTEVADRERRWTAFTFNGLPHVYNTRTAWALVRAGLRYGDERAIEVAKANLDWACRQQRRNGWFDHCAFSAGAAPFTHTTAYAGRGLLESGLLLGDGRYLDAARRVGRAAVRHVDRAGRLPGQIAVTDAAASSSTCLTGSAQFAILWLLLAEIDDADDRSEAEDYRAAARAVLADVGRYQRLDGPLEMRGAIGGSNPLWGRYAPLGFPNWPAKFFVDALILAEAQEPNLCQEWPQTTSSLTAALLAR